MMTEQERRDVAKAFFDDVCDLLGNLHVRYLDECQYGYEDIKDYAAPLVLMVEKIGGQFVKMTKRPFGFVYALDVATYHVTATMRQMKYKRIA